MKKRTKLSKKQKVHCDFGRIAVDFLFKLGKKRGICWIFVESRIVHDFLWKTISPMPAAMMVLRITANADSMQLFPVLQ